MCYERLMASKLQDELKAQLMAAMKAKDTPTANVIRMVNTRIMEKTTAGTERAEVTDAIVLEVIGAYKKSMEKARTEFAAAGESGKAQLAELDFEIEWCKKWLPQELTEDEVRVAVAQAVATLPTKDPKQAGRVIGMLKKQFGDRAEPNLVKKIAEELLA